MSKESIERGHKLATLVFRHGVEVFDECRCGNSRIQIKGDGEVGNRFEAQDIQDLVDALYDAQKKLKER